MVLNKLCFDSLSTSTAALLARIRTKSDLSVSLWNPSSRDWGTRDIKWMFPDKGYELHSQVAPAPIQIHHVQLCDLEQEGDLLNLSFSK